MLRQPAALLLLAAFSLPGFAAVWTGGEPSCRMGSACPLMGGAAGEEGGRCGMSRGVRLSAAEPCCAQVPARPTFSSSLLAPAPGPAASAPTAAPASSPLRPAPQGPPTLAVKFHQLGLFTLHSVFLI